MGGQTARYRAFLRRVAIQRGGGGVPAAEASSIRPSAQDVEGLRFETSSVGRWLDGSLTTAELRRARRKARIEQWPPFSRLAEAPRRLGGW